MRFEYDCGGQPDPALFHGDCAVSALAIVTGTSYEAARAAFRNGPLTKEDPNDVFRERKLDLDAVYRSFGLTKVVLDSVRQWTWDEVYARFGNCIVNLVDKDWDGSEEQEPDGLSHATAILDGALHDYRNWTASNSVRFYCVWYKEG